MFLHEFTASFLQIAVSYCVYGFITIILVLVHRSKQRSFNLLLLQSASSPCLPISVALKQTLFHQVLFGLFLALSRPLYRDFSTYKRRYRATGYKYHIHRGIHSRSVQIVARTTRVIKPFIMYLNSGAAMQSVWWQPGQHTGVFDYINIIFIKIRKWEMNQKGGKWSE